MVSSGIGDLGGDQIEVHGSKEPSGLNLLSLSGNAGAGRRDGLESIQVQVRSWSQVSFVTNGGSEALGGGLRWGGKCMIGRAENGMRPTVLVVDDESLVRGVVVRMLQITGYRTIEAEDGPTALQCLRGAKADPSEIQVVLLDWSMPGMSGEETYRQIDKAFPGVPVVIATGWSVEETRRSVEDLGRIHIVSKPFDSATLAKAIEDRLEDENEEDHDEFGVEA